MTSISICGAVTLALALPLAAPRVAQACGVMLFEEQVGRMGRQELFLDFSAEATTMVLSATYLDAATDLAFVLPLVSPPEAVDDADLGLFVALDGGTAPRVNIDDGDDGGRLCGGALRGDGGNLGGGDVIVYGRGQTATYSYVIVGGASEQSLTEWLGTNGFTPSPALSGALQGYADDGWVFLAAKVRADAPAGDLAPLELRLPAQSQDAFKIPFGIAAYALSGEQTLALTLYLSGAAPVMPGNYEAVTIAEDELQALSASESDYAAVYAAKSAGGRLVIDHREAGWSPSYLRGWYEEAQWMGAAEGIEVDVAWLEGFGERLGDTPRHLARLRGELRATDLRDMTLQTTTAADVRSSYQLDYREGCRAGGRVGDAFFLLLPLLWLRRRGSAARGSGRPPGPRGE